MNNQRNTYSYRGCLLPLSLLQFTAAKNAEKVTLNWKTTNEINTSYFIIQHSSDGIQFSDLGTVNSKRNVSTVNDYYFVDNAAKLTVGNNYYRLKMVDKDGKTITSKVVVVTIDNRIPQFSIMPNPASNFLVIKTNLLGGILTVTDFSSHVVIKQNLLNTAENRINISALPKGIYIVSLKTQGAVLTQKLIVE